MLTELPWLTEAVTAGGVVKDMPPETVTTQPLLVAVPQVVLVATQV